MLFFLPCDKTAAKGIFLSGIISFAEFIDIKFECFFDRINKKSSQKVEQRLKIPSDQLRK
ncbi:hypothetical protein BAU14_09550 [Enterococcus sp. CU9D]|nr:hypothetical protein BAU14_09550 [Enterococcus sp. CU9D]